MIAPTKKNFDVLDLVGFAGILLLGCLWFWVQWTQYHHFGYTSGDSSVAEQAMWNTTHGGRFFHQSFLGIEESNFREHLNFSRFLYVPLYYLYPHTLTLFFIIDLFYLIAGIALYFFTQRHVTRFGTILALALFLLVPLTGIQVAGPMHIVAVGGPLMLFVLMAYYEKRLRAFLLWLLPLALLSEFIAPTVFLIGVLALWDRRSWHWWAAPLSGGVLMWLAAKYYITIGFGSEQYLLERLRSILEPDRLQKRLDFVSDALRPLLWAPILFSKYALLLVPSVLIALFIISSGRLSTGGSMHLFVVIPPILTLVFIDLAVRWQGTKKLPALYLCCLLGLTLSAEPILKTFEPRKSAYTEEMALALTYVKDRGSVTASTSFGPALARRPEFFLSLNERYSDYIVVKLSKSREKKKEKAAAEGRVLEQSFEDLVHVSPDYHMLYKQDRVRVYVHERKIAELLELSRAEVDALPTEEIVAAWHTL